MIKGKKHLPQILSNSFIKKILANNFIIVITYWVFQSCRYSDIRESIFKISITILLTLTFIIWLPALWAFIIAHTINAFFNGHIPAMLIHMGIGKTTPKKFISKIEKIYWRMSKNKNIKYLYAYGSLSKGNYKPTSDIDLRLVPQNGKWIHCLLILLRERTLALINWFPLDIYAFTAKELSVKIKNDEPPIVFKEQNGLKLYDNSLTFENFREIFLKKNHLNG